MSDASPDLLSAVLPVTQTFEQLGIPYHIGGSVASSTLGIARTTLDVDLVADLRPEHIGPVVSVLQAAYYIDADMIAEAIAHQSSFNLVHLATMLKVDVFIPGTTPYARESFGRRRLDRLDEQHTAELYLASAEDVILHKLDWYRLGEEVAQRQWSDVLGVLRVQRRALDVDYLRRWANELELTDLLERALRETGLD